MLTTKQPVFFFALFVFVLSIFLPTFVRAETYVGDISINSTGGGNCALVGVWDGSNKTCTLTKDLSGSLIIGSAGITLDGAGYSISKNAQAPSFQRLGITVSGSSAVIKNINVENFSSCIIFNSGAINGRVENSTLSYCGSLGIYLYSSSGGHTFLNNNFIQNFLGIFVNSPNNTIEGNTFSANTTYGVRTYFSSNNIIKGNVFSDNGFGLRMEYGSGNKVTDNTIENSRSYGLYAIGSSTPNQNYIVNNNFINNGDEQVSVHDLNQYYDVMPVGGNYWSDYDTLNEGCTDLNSDSICDGPRYFNTYNPTYGDFNPWVRRDGWKTSPPTCFDGIQNQDETGIDVGGVCKILSSEKSVISFSFESLTPSVTGVVSETDHTISATVSFGTDVTALVPSIVVSTEASINPSDNLAQDFSSPVIYTVTAEDKSTQVYTVTVTPSCVTDCFSNVLFLPGLESSRLYTKRGDGSEDQLWEPNGKSDVEDLYLNTDGASKNTNIYTRDIIRETNTPLPAGSAGQNIYKSFADTMNQLVNDFKIADWRAYAYDWRQDINDIVNNGTKYEGETLSLVETLGSLVASSKNGKVTIVSHSNGGLLAKALLKKLQNDKVADISNLIDSVDVLILVAVPEIGTASALPTVMHGYDQRILLSWLLDEVHARELGRNMLGAYGLLPSKEYVNRVNASPVTFVDTVLPSGVTTDMVQAFGGAIDSYSEYKDFLFGAEGRINPAVNQINLPISLSQNLFSKAENLHDRIDAFTPPESMRVIEVAGWGLDTVVSFEYYPKCESTTLSGCVFILDERPKFTYDGDGTVVVPSAQHMSFLGSAEKYWVDLPEQNRQLRNFRKNREHADILEVNSLNNLITSVIKDGNIVLDAVLRNSKPLDTSNRLRLSVHSPVTIDAYDAEGNHTGKICPTGSDFCYAEENILNSSYLEFGEGKYINLPEDQMSKIKLQGTGTGTFTYESEKVLPNETSITSSFIDIPVTTQTQAEITLDQAGTPQLALDVTGDGVTDFNLVPSDTFDPILYLQIMKVTIDSLDLNQGQIKAFDNRVNTIIKAIQVGKIDNTKLKAEIFKAALQKTLAKPDPKTTKPKKLSKTDAQLLLDMLNKLLDNLN